jgi:hypothetical protein
MRHFYGIGTGPMASRADAQSVCRDPYMSCENGALDTEASLDQGHAHPKEAHFQACEEPSKSTPPWTETSGSVVCTMDSVSRRWHPRTLGGTEGCTCTVSRNGPQPQIQPHRGINFRNALVRRRLCEPETPRCTQEAYFKQKT